MNKNKIYQCLAMILFSGLLLVSCSSIANQPASSPTSAVVNPVFSVTPELTVIPSQTVTIRATQIEKTPTPRPTTTQTTRPEACPPFAVDESLPEPNLPENYIGYHYDLDKLPSDLVYLGGSVVSNRENPKDELGISNLGWQENARLYWLEKLICHDEAGLPYFEIVDAFATPLLSGNETVPWVCFNGETEVPFMDGLGIFDDSVPKVTIGDFQGWPYTTIAFLYDVDFATQKFVLLDTESLICLEGGRR